MVRWRKRERERERKTSGKKEKGIEKEREEETIPQALEFRCVCVWERINTRVRDRKRERERETAYKEEWVDELLLHGELEEEEETFLLAFESARGAQVSLLREVVMRQARVCLPWHTYE